MKEARGRPLAGIRVLDFTHVLAGPMCSRLLVDQGAEVLRVESIQRKEALRSPVIDPELGRNLAYVLVHRGKQSITIDLKTAAGADLARKLASVADVVVENFSSGAMSRLGLDFEALSKLNPRLIFLSMSGYGHNGPRKDWSSMNSNLQGYSGLMLASDEEDQPPVSISNSWMDYIGGAHGCFAVMEALARRAEDGMGRHVDLAQFECGVGTLGAFLLSGIVNGTRAPRRGCRSAHAIVQNCYRCLGNDEWCVIALETDEQWRAFVTLLGNPAWSADERFDSALGRVRHQAELDRHIEAWTQNLAPQEVERQLHAVGIPAERMRRMSEVLGDASDSIFDFVPGTSAPFLMASVPFSFIPREPRHFGEVPRLGEHTDHALRTWLGMGPEEIVALHRSGALA